MKKTKRKYYAAAPGRVMVFLSIQERSKGMAADPELKPITYQQYERLLGTAYRDTHGPVKHWVQREKVDEMGKKTLVDGPGEARAWVRVYGDEAEKIKAEAARHNRSVAQYMRMAVLGREPSLGLSAEIMSGMRYKISRVSPGMTISEVIGELVKSWLDGHVRLEREQRGNSSGHHNNNSSIDAR